MPQHMPLAEWDVKVKPKLQTITLSSNWIEYYARKVHDSAVALPGAPEWEMEAVEAAKRARDQLASATLTLNDALNKIATKPKVK